MDKPAYLLHRGDVLAAYGSFPAPAVVISDGAYGVRGFHGDTTEVGGLLDWYRQHMEASVDCDAGDHPSGSGNRSWLGDGTPGAGRGRWVTCS